VILVYALVPGPVPVRPPLRTVTVGSITAIIRDRARPARPADALLRRHDAIVRSLAASAPAILPVRFGTVVQDLEELRLLLGARQRTLLERLRAVRGRVQMTVRFLEAEHVREKGVRSGRLPWPGRSRGQAARSGTAYLKARAAERDVAGFAPVRDAVRRWVRDERVEKRGTIASVYHLVPRSGAAAYRRTLERAAAEAGVRMLVSGPWPPYAFATTWP
jgi:hypothetical protein